MATRNPTFNLKTGADSDLIVAREVTSGDKVGKIKRADGIFRFPYLTRRTGDSLTGTTENIESNELKHGRTKSAPRKGTSSSSGDINFEFSAETFDDMMEAVFRGKWKRWVSDTNSVSNKKKDTYANGFFSTKCASDASGKQLIGGLDSDALIKVKNPDAFIVHELNSETEDIKYSLLRKYGGQTGEDLWQEFTHVALNTMQLSVEINSIITGSFGIMGANNPKLRDSKEVVFDFENRVSSVFDTHDKGAWAVSTDYKVNDVVSNSDKWYRCKENHTSDSTSFATDATKWATFKTKQEALEVTLVNKGAYDTSATYAVNDAVVYNDKWYRCVETIGTAEAFTSAHWVEFEAEDYFASIPDYATDTMQFTAREGFLYVNGKQIEFAQSLSFSLDNGLTQKFAIFVPNAISTTPLALDITGDLSTYLIGGTESDAKKMYNDAIDNETVEILFCLQDNLDDPTSFYVFQIFNTKNTESTINGNGEDTFDESLPWASFGEQACRVFRVMLPRFTRAEAAASSSSVSYADTVVFTPNVELTGADIVLYNASTAPDGIRAYKKVGDATETEITLEVDTNIALSTTGDTEGQVILTHGIAQTAAAQNVSIRLTWNGNEITKSFEISASS